MSDLQEEILQPVTSAFIELFTLDTTVIGGSTIFRYVPMVQANGAIVKWQSQDYLPFPIDAHGFHSSSDGSSPAKPKLSVSNVSGFLMASILELGDLVGAKIIRCRTFSRFLDNGPEPDPNAHLPYDIYLIDQKTNHTKSLIEWSLISMVDRPDIALPLRRVLKDQTSNNLYAPGVGRNKY
jgi:lambda family phage minor tail protein L